MKFHHLAFCFILSASGLIRGQSWEEIRHLAEAQHEIVMLLIEKGEFSKVPEAAAEIFALKFPPDQEHLLLKEVEILVDALLQQQQIGVAHQVVDAALQCVSTSKAKAQLHRERGYLFKNEGKTEDAMKSFEESKALEKNN